MPPRLTLISKEKQSQFKKEYMADEFSFESIESLTDEDQASENPKHFTSQPQLHTENKRKYNTGTLRGVKRSKTVEDLIKSFDESKSVTNVTSLKFKDFQVRDGFQSQLADSISWVQKYTPNNSFEISIHKKKLEDVKKVLVDMIYANTSNRILILSGPSGCGKSITAKLLCNELMSQKMAGIKESNITTLAERLLINSPSTSKSKNFEGEHEYIIEYNNLTGSTTNSNSSVTYFSEFLNQCKLLTGFNEKCIIVEELPNIYHRLTQVNFQDALQDWLDMPSSIHLPPLIICITEFDIDTDFSTQNSAFTIDTTFKVETVLGYKLLQNEHNGWKRIKLNPVAKTFMKRALDRVISGEHLIFPKRDILKVTNELSTLGDIRNSINMFEYWVKFFYNPQLRNLGYEVLGKETGFNIFHSIGKLIYGTSHGEEELNNFRKRLNLNRLLTGLEVNESFEKIDTITVENVSNDIISNLIKFNLCCLENYAAINPEIDDNLRDLLDVFSISDCLCTSSKYNDVETLNMAAYYSCSGIRLKCGKMKRKGYIKKLMFSRDSKLRKKLRDIESEITDFQKRRTNRLINSERYSHLTNLDSILIDGFYQSRILSSFKFKLRKFNVSGGNMRLLSVKRLGGDFKNLISVDNQFKVEDDESQRENNREELKKLEAIYFGIYENDNKNYEIDDDTEFESDPIEESDATDTLQSLRTPFEVDELQNEDWDDWDDSFSDDSIVRSL